MSSWRDAILNDFVPHVSKLTLVADPDTLLSEEKLALELRQRGFDLIEFADSVEFRYAYESNYRAIWDKGEHTDLVVILRLQDGELEKLPYDLLRAGRKLSFNLGELFPAFSYPVIEKLDRSLLDDLYAAQQKAQPDCMGEYASKDFILRHLFGIAAELITSDVELLRALLRLHYGQVQVPGILAERLIQVLRGQARFNDWPLVEIVPDGEAFFSFLQERWPIFLAKSPKTNCVAEETTAYNLKYTGPSLLPFDHQDIKVYIDNLFVEGKLIPVQADDLDVKTDSWIRCGLKPMGVKDLNTRLNRLFERVAAEMPSPACRYADWTTFALKWAELTALVYGECLAQQQQRLRSVGEAINQAFGGWLKDHYASLINLPPANPAMLHHVSRRMARDMEESATKRTALIVVDGLALDQWVTVRQLLQKQDRKLVVREQAAFAWIPTITSVSRQSIFAGRPPIYYPGSIHTTNNEEKLWKQFWEGHGYSRLDVVYQRGLGDGDVEQVLERLIHPGKTKVVGLVIDKVDNIMHGMQLGSAGMHNQLKQWCRQGFLGKLIKYLLAHNYELWLTADHGNIECSGRGRPAEGVIAETRGERARIYPTAELRSHVSTVCPFAQEWVPTGLPQDYYPLVTTGRDAFVNPGETLVAHGGISIEEVIVPLVKFERRG